MAEIAYFETSDKMSSKELFWQVSSEMSDEHVRW